MCRMMTAIDFNGNTSVAFPRSEEDIEGALEEENRTLLEHWSTWSIEATFVLTSRSEPIPFNDLFGNDGKGSPDHY